eukprot:359913-Chlamydomonas_euryale.AAC.1
MQHNPYEIGQPCAVRVSSDSDGDEERDAAELDSAVAEGGLKKYCRQTGAESEGMSLVVAIQIMMMHQHDGADVGQLTAIAQRLVRDQRAQRGRVQGMSAPSRPQSV